MEYFSLQERSKEKALTILGGSKSKYPFLKRCKKAGYKVILFDRDDNCYCKRYSDYYFQISTAQSSKIVSVLKGLKNIRIKGVLCYSSKKEALITASIIASKYSIPGFTKKAVTNTYNKIRLKSTLIHAGVPTPPFSKATYQSLKKRRLKFPVIVKPIEGLGSSNVVIIRSEKCLERYLQTVNQSIKQIIVEKYVRGKLFHIDGFVQNGRIGVFSISEKKVAEINNIPLTSGYILTNDFFSAKSAKPELINILQKGVSSLGIDNHLFGADIIVTGDGKKYIIEIGFLMDSKMDELLHFAGIDPYETLLNIVTGREQIKEKSLNMNYVYALKFLYANTSGRFIIKEGIALPNDLALKIVWEKQNSSLVDQPRSVADILGRFLVRSKNKGLWSELKRIEEKLFVIEKVYRTL